MDENAIALGIAAKVIQYLTDNVRGKESNLAAAAALAESQLHTSHTISFKAYTEGEDVLDKCTYNAIERVSQTEWFKKHGGTAMEITNSHKTIQWVDDGSKSIMMMDNVPTKRVTKHNANIYKALRTVYNPSLELCLLGIPKKESRAFNGANVMEMNWEKNITANAAIDHARTYVAAVTLLNTLI